MRNWNMTLLYSSTSPESWFGSYLWGIETWATCPRPWASVQFGSYLWGIETWKGVTKYDFWAIGLDRTYEELKHPLAASDGRPECVWIVPMRNWNGRPGVWRFSDRIRVWIVPMRNWNLELPFASACLEYPFGSYLWGIETRFRWSRLPSTGISCLDRTYEELKQKIGGDKFSSISAKFGSYLWGIETCFDLTS